MIKFISLFIVLVSSLFLSSCSGDAVFEPIFGKVAFDQPIYAQSHIDAIGAVYSYAYRRQSIGTGTYIGGKKILTAAHVVMQYLPKNVADDQKNIIVDVTKENVYWSNQEMIQAGVMQSKTYKVNKIIVDSRFVRNGGNQTMHPTLDMMKYDMAVLKLAIKPNIKPMPLVNLTNTVPSVAGHVGYGDGAYHTPYLFEKKTSIQYPSRVMKTPNGSVMFTNQTVQRVKRKNKERTNRLVANRKGKYVYRYATRAKSGDSGGPIYAIGSDKQIRIIGVLSAFSKSFNSFAMAIEPQVNKSLKQYNWVKEMLNAAQ